MKYIISFILILSNLTFSQSLGNCLQLLGDGSYADVPTNQSLDITKNITIEFWIKINSYFSNYMRVVDKMTEGQSDGYLVDISPEGKIRFILDGMGVLMSNSILPLNKWSHISCTSDSVLGKARIYVNRNVDAEYIGSTSITTSIHSLKFDASSGTSSLWLNGQLEELRIWNLARTQAQLFNTMYDTLSAEYFANADSGLIGYWRFDELEDLGVNYDGVDDVRDYSFMNNHADLVGNAVLVLTTNFSVFAIDSVYPHQNSNYFQPDETIKVFFSQPMDSASIVSANTNWRRVYVHGSLTGKHLFDVSYHSSNNSMEIVPAAPLKPGELITVSLDSLILTASGNNITPYIFQFNVKPEKGTVKFAVADSFQLNFSPTNIVSGDFNNDTKVDVIVSNYDSLKYTVLLNNGQGGFTLGEEMSGVFKPYSISFTDIDNDRDLDMIVSTNEENKIRLLRGNGQGDFSWILPTIDVNAPVATCPGDFDGDGDNDFVAILNYSFLDARAYMYKNDGNGSFTQSGFVYIGYPASKRNVVGDFDNDGDLDIVVGQSELNATVRTLINDGTGNFIYSSGSNMGPYPDELAGGDFDGDFDLDIIYCEWYQNGLGIMLNDSSGSFTSYLNLGNVGGQSRNPVANDFDCDGDLDFVVNFNNNNIGIVKNNGYPAFELYLSYPLSGLKGITGADFDNKGSIDLVGISSTTNQIKFLKNCVDSLVAYYPFNNNTKDASGNINDGINFNGVFDKDRYGYDNSSIYFDGVYSYVEGINPGNNLPIGNSPRSFTAWIKNNQYNQWGSNIFQHGTAQAAPTNFHFWYH